MFATHAQRLSSLTIARRELTNLYIGLWNLFPNNVNHHANCHCPRCIAPPTAKWHLLVCILECGEAAGTIEAAHRILWCYAWVLTGLSNLPSNNWVWHAPREQVRRIKYHLYITHWTIIALAGALPDHWLKAEGETGAWHDYFTLRVGIGLLTMLGAFVVVMALGVTLAACWAAYKMLWEAMYWLKHGRDREITPRWSEAEGEKVTSECADRQQSDSD